jgi:hypothetical protein
MQLKDEADHIAILSLMMVGVLTKRMNELGHLDESTSAHLHRLVSTVREHAQASGVDDLKILFDNIDKALN